ncbi:hypothetical protein BH10BAC5_BH10BAC5_25590 [soil metagenome]
MQIAPGTIIQNYKVISQYAEGGMGVIYLARHTKLERDVIIKVLRADFFNNNDIKQRFFAEANTLSKLSHPNIVSIYDYVEIDGQFYLILEFAEGVSMDGFIKIRRSEADAVDIFSQVLEGFSYAHRNHIIHRDIKPSNIIISSALVVKILDFGIAKILNRNDSHTRTGTSMGTIIYMSPEQILGKPVDNRTDIYSIGITLYEFLTGSNPYGSSDISEYEIQTKILNEDLVFTNSISPKFRNIINKASAKDPGQRYYDCMEFKADLLSDSVTHYAPTGNYRNDNQQTKYVPPPYIEERPRTSKTAFIAIISVVLICAASIFVFYFNTLEKEKIVDNKTNIPFESNTSTKNESSVTDNRTSQKDIKENIKEKPKPLNTINNSEEEDEVRQAVKALLNAWQQKKIDRFFNLLTDDYYYQSSGGVTRTFSERRNKAYEIFAANSFISISTSNMSVSINGDNAEVKYDQDYHSTTMNESTTKKLFLRKNNNTWKVYKELSGYY